MAGIKRYIKQYQLLSFFVLTYLSSWLLFLPYYLSGNDELLSILAFAGLFCPAFSNLLISRIIAPVPDQYPKKHRRIAFWVTWVVATASFTLYTIYTSGLASSFAIIIFAVFALPPAFVVSSSYSKFPGIRKSLSSLLNPRGSIGWYLFALFIPWVTKWISLPFNSGLGWKTLSEPDPVPSLSAWTIMLTVSFLYMLLFAGGVNEETGWTGFALPRLQARFNPLVASMLLWALWILWHLPYQVTGMWNPDPHDFIRALIGTFFARFLFTWLFNKTRGGMLTAILFHASANVSFDFLPATYVHMILEAALALGVVLGARMWRKLPAVDPGMYQEENGNT
jgi:membrane protease YdiL (CAAX protease family)